MKKDNFEIANRFSLNFKKITFLFIVIFVFSACQTNEYDLTGITGSKAPDFSLTSTDGGIINLFDYNNKVIVLFFFGNDSPASKTIAQDIEKTLIDSTDNKSDFVVLGVDFFNGNMNSVRAFKRETSSTYPLLLNAGNVGTVYNTTYNRIVIIDQKQNIVFSGTQDASKDITTVKEKLNNLLAK